MARGYPAQGMIRDIGMITKCPFGSGRRATVLKSAVSATDRKDQSYRLSDSEHNGFRDTIFACIRCHMAVAYHFITNRHVTIRPDDCEKMAVHVNQSKWTHA